MPSKPRKRYREIEDVALFFVKAALAVFAIFAFSTMSVAPFTATCGACHRATVVSHREAQHAEMSCHTCHSGATLPERLEFRVRYSRMLASAIFNQRTDGASVSNDRCAECHAAEIRQTLVSETGIRISHTDKVGDGYLCTDCHSLTGHALTGVAERRVDMFSCFSCHDSREEARCDRCHAAAADPVQRDPVYVSEWRLTHGPNWEALHGMGDANACNICHASTYCAKCHAVELPHGTGFFHEHGRVTLAAGGADACTDCHDEQRFCFNCHQVEMPHPDDYLRQHTATTAETQPRCMRCHDQAACDACHADHVHVDLLEPREWVVPEFRERLRVD